ncbi:MAG TPA: hypothetical protein VNY27_06575 [Solirubrobacteraceae bacterium]|nr:hypothetical protein [Solirubrobacteraceae bacterium]
MLWLAAGAVPALAESGAPWWRIGGTAIPSTLPQSGFGRVVVTAANLGDGEANGSSSPITVTDKLPAGVVAVGISGGVGPAGNFGSGECSLERVSCRFENGVPPYLTVAMTLTVRVEPGAVSGAVAEAAVVGGGAPPAVFRQRLNIGAAPAFGVETYELNPEAFGGAPDVQAGSHPFQLTSTLNLNQTLVSGGVKVVSLAKDLRFSLPPGLVGNPTAVPKCPSGEFSEVTGSFGNACPLDAAIGVADVAILLPSIFPSPITVPVPLYNIEPQVGEPARFGFVVFGIPVLLDTSVRTGGDYGVVVTVRNISQAAEFIGAQVTFWGVPGDPRHDSARGWNCLYFGVLGNGPCQPLGASSTPPLLTLPTSCSTPWSTSLAVFSWAEPSVPRSIEYNLQDTFGSPLGLDGCNRLSFEPSIAVSPDAPAGSTPTGLTVGIHVPQDAGLSPNGVAQATVKDTTVALPAGVTLNPAAADGLSACGLGEIGLETPEPITCPESAKVGTVEIHTPLLPDPLVGAAYLAAQNANPFGSLVALYIVAHDPVSGVLVKLAGEVKPDPVTGQLVSTFKNTPQLPFEDLKLHFFGGSRAPLGTPALCGAYTTTSSIAPWSGNAPAQPSSTFNIASGPGGAACANPLPFAPSLTAGSTNIQAGAFTPFTTTMSREDGQQTLQGIQLHMPSGLSGLLSDVKLCGEQQGDEGTCGAESLIGETTVSVGVGSTPFSVKGGRVYITGPYKGAPFGLSIVNPAKAGPFDLEKSTACDCVVVRAKIDVDPTTAALTITTDDTGPYKIPTIIQGIPLQIKHVNVTITRPGFTFNPTSCANMAITGSLQSTEGAVSTLAVPFQVTNCATLKFTPKFTVSTSGKTSKANGASLSVKLAYPRAPFGSQANIARVRVDLPRQLPSRLTTLQRACTAAQFKSNPAGCPAASVVGHARAVTPLLPVLLEGPAYFVSNGGEAFPNLIVVLQGYGVTIDLVGDTFISKAGITSSTFKTVPDQPVTSFELTLPQGPYSALTANGNLCASKLAMPTEFVAQNGMAIHQSTPVGVTGCAKKRALTRAQKLAAALRVCHKDRSKAKRATCEHAAHRRYGPSRKRK